MKYRLRGVSTQKPAGTNRIGLKTSKVMQGLTVALSLVVIGAMVLSPSSAAAATIGVLEAETMTLNPPTSGSIINGGTTSTTYLRLTATGAVATGTINSTGSTTSVIVRAKANQCNGSPQLRLSVDNVVIFTPTITNDGKLLEYTALLAVGMGSHDVKLELLNFYKQGTCNRNAIIDAISLIGTEGPPPDTIAPTVSISSPTEGATVSGQTAVTATATDNVGVTKVDFYVAGSLVATDVTAPYEYAWDTSLVADGMATLTAKAYDAASGVSTSTAVSVTVDNIPFDPNVPTVSITSPAENAQLVGTVTVTAEAADDESVANVEFYVNDSLVASDLEAPYEYVWDTLQAAEGNATLTTKAYDVGGATGSSQPVVVTVDNVSAPLPPYAPSDTNDLTDVPYGAHALQKMDIYPATNGRTGEAVILVHGGAWRDGDKANHVKSATDLAANGFTVFNVNYRLASQTVVGYPMEVEDIEAAARWVAAYGGSYRADTLQINMVGGSSGAHLVLLSSLRLNKTTPGFIRSVASLSAPTDFVTVRTRNSSVDVFLGCDVMTTCSDALLAEASPRFNVGPTCPSIYVMHGANESLSVVQATSMYDTLIAAGCVAQKNIMAGSSLHSFSYWDQVNTSIYQWFNSN